jgi:dihydrofolate reductase
MITSIIVSVAKNGCIGGNNTLLWKQSEDLKRFKSLTLDQIVIMGQKTYESLPFKPLKKRINIVISDDPTVNFKGCIMARSIKESVEIAKENTDNCNDKMAYIIGGGSIYKQFISIVDRLYITRINAEIQGDTYFPEIDLNIWEKIFSESHEKNEDNEYNYTYEIYKRISGNISF